MDAKQAIELINECKSRTPYQDKYNAVAAMIERQDQEITRLEAQHVFDNSQIVEYEEIIRVQAAKIERQEKMIPKWISVNDELPEPYQDVLITYMSPAGPITIIANFVRKLEREVDVDSCSFSEDTYDEETDCCWWPVGWYEAPCQNSHEDQFWRVNPKLYQVTHWQPLPEPPRLEEAGK